MKKVALVTGGSRGIGFGIATRLAREGFDLAINGMRDEADVQQAIQQLAGFGAEILYCQGNIADAKDRQAIYDKIQSHFGRLHVLVNNAGVAPRVRLDLLETTEESFDYVIQTNLKGTFFMAQQAANWMVEQKSADDQFDGCIVNITSISATVASVNRGEYCIAKAGLSMTTQLFAARLGEHRIPVYEVRPGIIKTDMTAGVHEKYDKLFAGGLCIQNRWGTTEDIGKAVASLVRGDFAYASGQVFMLDGGLTVQRL
jgi:NAD(P)-dependent dehydrogenase (short-subunit alcohol dehydrogenase family)